MKVEIAQPAPPQPGGHPPKKPKPADPVAVETFKASLHGHDQPGGTTIPPVAGVKAATLGDKMLNALGSFSTEIHHTETRLETALATSASLTSPAVTMELLVASSKHHSLVRTVNEGAKTLTRTVTDFQKMQ
jgi:hypothetical protein